MGHEISSYDDDYEWVKVEALQRFNISKRPWSQGKNIGLSEGETYILPRGRTERSGYAEGMRFYFENDGFLKVVDSNPEEVYGSVGGEDVEPEEQTDEENDEVFECKADDCSREFDTERGRDQHFRQVHEERENGEEDGSGDEQ